MPCNIQEELEEFRIANSRVNPIPEQQKQYDLTLSDLQSFLAHQIPSNKSIKIIDVGCAYGTLTGYLSGQGHEMVAVDGMDELSSPKWWDEHNIPFAKVNIETQPIPFKGNELALFTEVIEHLCYNPVPVIENIRDTLKPGGHVICTTPMKELQGIVHPIEGRYARYAHYRDIPLPWNGYEFEDAHHYFYRKPELMQLFHECGFEVEQCYSIRAGTTHFLKARKV